MLAGEEIPALYHDILAYRGFVDLADEPDVLPDRVVRHACTAVQHRWYPTSAPVRLLIVRHDNVGPDDVLSLAFAVCGPYVERYRPDTCLLDKVADPAYIVFHPLALERAGGILFTVLNTRGSSKFAFD